MTPNEDFNEFMRRWRVVARDLNDALLCGTATTSRRKVPYLKPNDTRNVTVDAKTSDGPWRVDVESVDWNWQGQ